MNTQKGSSKIGVVAICLGALALVLIMGLARTSSRSLGGNFNPVNIDNYSYSVSGTEVISHALAVTATSLTVSGATTISGDLTSKIPVVAPAGDATLTIAQSGSLFKMNTAGEDLTLPAVATAAGVHYKFAVTAAVATTNMTIVSTEGDNIEGSLIVAGAVVDCDANDVITFVIDGENIGDFVELYSDGTSWLIGASGGLTASKMTCSG